MQFETFRPTAAREATPAEIQAWTGGHLVQEDRAPARLGGIATLEDATEHDISFIVDQRHALAASSTRAGLIVCHKGTKIAGKAMLLTEEVWTTVVKLMEQFDPPKPPQAEIHPTAVIAPSAQIGAGAAVGPYCVIGERAQIGAGAQLGPHCIVDDDCIVGAETRFVARVTLVGRVLVGDRVLVHPGAVLGADGFAFKPAGGVPMKIPQIGAVVIEDEVEIGANTTIDRAFLSETRIGRATKIDNLVQIAHNVRIGNSTLIAAKVGIAGSSKLGRGCLVGGGAVMRDGVSLGDGCTVAGFAGVTKDWPAGTALGGFPAIPANDWGRQVAALHSLPDYAKRLRLIERKLETATLKREE